MYTYFYHATVLNTDKKLTPRYFIAFVMHSLKLQEPGSAVGGANVLFLTLDGRRLK